MLRWPPILSSTGQLRTAEKAVFAHCMQKKIRQCFQVRFKLYYQAKISYAKISFQWHFNDQPGTFTCNRTRCKTAETERTLADRFREHLRDAEQNNTDAPKPVARHFNLPNHSHHNMTIYGLSLHHGNTESRKNLEQKFIFQLGTLSPHGINERLSFH